MKFFFILLFSSLSFCVNGQAAENNNKDLWPISDFFNNSTISMCKTLIKEIYQEDLPVLPVSVQVTNDLCKEEKRFLRNRLSIIQKNLKEHFAIESPLRIGFCCSGGGNRAMIGTLGFLTGAAKANILDSTLYIAGLSGSTWLISQLCFLAATSYKQKSFENILEDIKKTYIEMLHDTSMLHLNGIYFPPLISFESTDDVCIEVAKRFAYEQPMSLVNLFGFLVGDYALKLLGNDRLSEKWSRIFFEVQKGLAPLPLCAAIFEKTKSKYAWFEMSPLQCGSAELGYLPVNYLGSYFNEGSLDEQKIYPEYPLSFYLGMYGSAFAATIRDIAKIQKEQKRSITLLKNNNFAFSGLPEKNILNNHSIQNLIHMTIKDLMISRNALTFAQFPNFSKGLESSVLKDQEMIGLFDAGIAFDIPLPLLVDRQERNLDLIFLYGSFPGKKSVLDDLTRYCFSKKIPFPDTSMIASEDLAVNDMTVLNDPRTFDYDATLATYIYFPTNGIDLYSYPYITLNFKYLPENIHLLAQKTEQLFLNNLDQIIDILKLISKKRYG
ncbi:hypothetical protein HYV11_00825 [Candidatus Dependentiae bacterium]|nr:hypothetical protein [Candidatus Dependentiae bacterium]